MTGVEDVRTRRRDRMRKRLAAQTGNRSTVALLATLAIAGVLVLGVFGGLALVEDRNERIGQLPVAHPTDGDGSVVLTLPSEPVPMLRVDADAIRLDGEVIVILDHGALPDGALDAEGRLTELLQPLRLRAEAGGRRCKLTAAPETPFRLLSRVHATAVAAGLSRVEVVDEVPAEESPGQVSPAEESPGEVSPAEESPGEVSPGEPPPVPASP